MRYNDRGPADGGDGAPAGRLRPGRRRVSRGGKAVSELVVGDQTPAARRFPEGSLRARLLEAYSRPSRRMRPLDGS